MIENGTRPFPYAPVMTLPTFHGDPSGGTTSCQVNPQANTGETREGLRDRVKVAETNVCSGFITVLELVQEQSEFRLGRDSAPLDDRICGKIVVGGHDRP